MAIQSSTVLMEQALKKWKPEQALAYLSKTYHVNGNLDYLTACTELLHHFFEDTAFFHSALWSIKREIFTTGAQMPAKQIEKLTYKKLAPKYLKFVESTVKNIKLPNVKRAVGAPKKLMIIGGQFLKAPHSPSMCMLEFARLAKQAGFEQVQIFNVNEFPEKAHSTFHEGFLGTPALQTGLFQQEYMGDEVEIFAAEEQGLNLPKIQNCIDHVESYDPDCILTVGDMNTVADICSRFLPSMCWPTTQSVPLSNALVQYYRSAEEPKSLIDWKRLKKAPPAMIPQNFDLMTVAENGGTINRDILKVSKDAFLFAVVGARIEQELTVEFQKVLVGILDANPKAHILIVGTDNFAPLVQLKPYAARIRLMRYTTDLRSALSVSDAFLNPPRQGGGNAAYWSLFESLPILTLDDCDVQMTIQQDAAVQTLSELEALAISVMNDESLYAEYKAKSVAQVSSLKSSTASSDNIKVDIVETIERFKEATP